LQMEPRTILNNFIGYKDCLVFEKYRKFSGDIEVFLKYAEIQAKGKTTIYIKNLVVETNTRDEIERGIGRS